MKLFLKKKEIYQNFKFIDERRFNGIIQKKYVSVGTDYFIYLNEETGPIIVISSDLIANTGIVCYLKEHSEYNSQQIDSLQTLCLKIFNGSGGVLKEKSSLH